MISVAPPLQGRGWGGASPPYDRRVLAIARHYPNSSSEEEGLDAFLSTSPKFLPPPAVLQEDLT